MNSSEIREFIEKYPYLKIRHEKLLNKLINSSWRNPDQEISLIERLEASERNIEFIEYAIYESNVLTNRESCILDYRIHGDSYREIANVFSLSHERIRQIAEEAYDKLEKEFKKQAI